MIRRTSIDTYNKIKESGALSARRWECYQIVYEHGPMTSNEVFKYSVLRAVPDYRARHNFCARMTELREMGVLEEVGETICSVTGQTVILWDVSGRMPIKHKKASKLSDRMADLEERVTAIERTIGQSVG